MARMGRLEEAVALIGRTPTNCYRCLTARARIAELAGDRAAADRWSAEARRQGPSLPFAFAERGQMLMGRGDIAGAIDFYEQAIERGPRWADPQKYWGDALLARGDEAGAIRKYRAAADRAPRWGALHLAWGRALEAQGRRDQARANQSHHGYQSQYQTLMFGLHNCSLNASADASARRMER
jgi:tetratricopeptide (TPR) repeat protein